MKKGNVEVLELDNEVFSVNVFSKDILFTYLFKEDIKDLHSLLAELLETERKCACNKMGPCTYHYLHPKGETETVKESESNTVTITIPEGMTAEEFLNKSTTTTSGIYTPPSNSEKEECMKCTCGKENCIDCCRKEEPTTPEKKCCDCFGKEPISLGVVLGGGEFKCQCRCHKKKLPSERISEIQKDMMKELGDTENDMGECLALSATGVEAIVRYLDEQHKKK